MKYCLSLLALALTGSHVLAEPRKDYPKVDDTSFTEPNGNRVVRLSSLLSASVDDVWQVLTTSEGWKSFAVAFACVDLQVGGIIETSYRPNARTGDPDNIKNEIVAYVPRNMLAIRCVQAPLNFQHKQEFFATSTVIQLIPLKKNKTRVVMVAAGYRPGPAYDALFEKFRWGDAYTLEKLRQRFESGRPAAPETGAGKNLNTKGGNS
jgi:hypothetical protein